MGVVLRASRVEVSIGLLRQCDDVEHRVDVALELVVGERLEDVAGTLDGLVRVGVVERIGHHLVHIDIVGVGLHVLRGTLKVLVASLALTL